MLALSPTGRLDLKLFTVSSKCFPVTALQERVLQSACQDCLGTHCFYMHDVALGCIKTWHVGLGAASQAIQTTLHKSSWLFPTADFISKESHIFEGCIRCQAEGTCREIGALRCANPICTPETGLVRCLSTSAIRRISLRQGPGFLRGGIQCRRDPFPNQNHLKSAPALDAREVPSGANISVSPRRGLLGVKSLLCLLHQCVAPMERQASS